MLYIIITIQTVIMFVMIYIIWSTGIEKTDLRLNRCPYCSHQVYLIERTVNNTALCPICDQPIEIIEVNYDLLGHPIIVSVKKSHLDTE